MECWHFLKLAFQSCNILYNINGICSVRPCVRACVCVLACMCVFVCMEKTTAACKINIKKVGETCQKRTLAFLPEPMAEHFMREMVGYNIEKYHYGDEFWLNSVANTDHLSQLRA